MFFPEAIMQRLLHAAKRISRGRYVRPTGEHGRNLLSLKGTGSEWRQLEITQK